MTDQDLNPFAAPGSSTSTDSAAVSLRDLFQGSLKSILDGPDGALRTGLRITLAALLFELCLGLPQSLFFMASPTAPLGGGTLTSILGIIVLLFSAAMFGEFVGACFLWKGSPKPRILAASCCCILVIKAVLDFLLPRFLNASEFSIVALVVSLIFGCAFTVTRLLLLKKLSRKEGLHRLANIVIAITIFMALVLIALIIWHKGLNKPLNFDQPLGMLFMGFRQIVYVVVSVLEFRVVYRVLCEQLTTSVESFA